MPTRKTPTPKRDAAAGRMTLDEIFAFWSFTPVALAERYGSLDAARERYDYLVSIGSTPGPWEPGGPPIVGGEEFDSPREDLRGHLFELP